MNWFNQSRKTGSFHLHIPASLLKHIFDAGKKQEPFCSLV